MFTTRPLTVADAPACTEIVNHIIALGGTTAYEEPFSVKGFTDYYVHDAAIGMVVESAGRVVGFQGLFEVEPGIYSIGSFTDQKSPQRGAGKAMFAATLKAARAAGGTAILAKITSDNVTGLAFYSRMGFEDFETRPNDHQRPSGHWVDRIVKKFVL